ncbi:efflux RND transporter periplasmic adaptor subunit [Nitratireductor basaltis]|uniref:RND family efflux transporter MFP subunit n=1 Tax=Nitratireductor basaltis TaxID=472175 RepID=A0A084UDR3_9HYPH|nr:efflux RND transporter periplasmic adaptor subunit [Nitratireductor basaltis]KFB11099.1 RND family efflux transporter MFP subunit [Nitratireductor basaltis]
MADPVTDTQTQRLEFDADRGSSRSRWIALGLIAALVLWMGSGFVFPAPEAPPETRAEPKPVSVATRQSVAEPVPQIFVAEGQALPDRDTTIRAETGGEIAEVLVEKGAFLEAGAVIGRFVLAEREAQLETAREELSRAQREYDNANTLLEKGVATVDRVRQAQAALAAAKAQVASAEEAVENTVIRAPFAGRLEELQIDIGEYVAAGSDVARIVDNTPLTVAIQVPQQAVRSIKPGQKAEVSFITGETAEGEVVFVGSSANAETRTFRTEITVPNADGNIAAGISAEIRIPTGEVVAHFISPAILSLGTDGTLGVKTVTEDDLVEFHEVEIVRAEVDGLWVRGLPDTVRLITVGQGFVNQGEKVAPRTAGELDIEAVEAATPQSAEPAE